MPVNVERYWLVSCVTLVMSLNHDKPGSFFGKYAQQTRLPPNDGAESLSSARAELVSKNWKLVCYCNASLNWIKDVMHNCVINFGLLEFNCFVILEHTSC